MLPATETELPSSSGHAIRLLGWSPGSAPTHVIQILHGLGEYADRYARFAEAATDQATRALLRAESVEDAEAAARANEIARAALVLAERQLDRRAVQDELFETQRRLTATRERANALGLSVEQIYADIIPSLPEPEVTVLVGNPPAFLYYGGRPRHQ